MKVLSLFAGMGGFDLGFEMAGFDVVAAFLEPEAGVRTKNFHTTEPDIT